ncbi:MAG: hypothetical protein ACO236_00415 [Candidatus Nanopelagicaceae bacterium]
MTMLYDPRPLEDPSYWNTWPDFDEYCQKLEWVLEDDFGIKKNKEELKKDWYAEWYYENGEDVEAAANAIARDAIGIYEEE